MLLAVSICFLCLAGGRTTADELRVAAASDLTKAFAEMGAAYQKRTGTHVALTLFGASGILTRQLENGAPFDLFAAANTSYLDELNARGLILADDVHIYAVGHIGLFVRKGAPAPPSAIDHLADSRFEHIAIANPKVLPYGKAAQEALEAAHVWEAVQARLVTPGARTYSKRYSLRRPEMRISQLSPLLLGKRPAGSLCQFPDKLHQPINQAIGALKSSSNLAGARKFIAFVLSKDGQAILKKYSFTFPQRERSVAH